MSNDLSAKVETLDRFKVNGYLSLRPLALLGVSKLFLEKKKFITVTHSSEFIPLNLLLIPTSESPFVYEIGKLLLHQLLDFRDRFVQSRLTSAGNMEIQWRVLRRS